MSVGVHHVELVVTTSDGESASDVLVIHVSAPEPNAAFLGFIALARPLAPHTPCTRVSVYPIDHFCVPEPTDPVEDS